MRNILDSTTRTAPTSAAKSGKKGTFKDRAAATMNSANKTKELPFPTGEEEEEQEESGDEGLQASRHEMMINDDDEDDFDDYSEKAKPVNSVDMMVLRNQKGTLLPQDRVASSQQQQQTQAAMGSSSSKNLFAIVNMTSNHMQQQESKRHKQQNQLLSSTQVHQPKHLQHHKVPDAPNTSANNSQGFQQKKKNVNAPQTLQLGKPSLKLLLAQQTTKPDPMTKSPPITSNCQSNNTSIVTTQTRNSPKSSSGAASGTTGKNQTARTMLNPLGALLQQQQQQTTPQQSQNMMFSTKHQQHQTTVVNQQQQVPFQLPQSSRDSKQQHKTQQSHPQGGFPKARKTPQMTQRTLFQSQQQAPSIVTTSGRPSAISLYEKQQRNSANLVQQPKVGKQLTDMIGDDGPRPSIPGDIDDVANLVSPSPQRKPGKPGQNKLRQSTVLQVQSNDLGVSTVTEGSIREVSAKQRLSVDLCDLKDLELINSKEFNSHLTTPKDMASQGETHKASTAAAKQSQLNPKSLIQCDLVQFRQQKLKSQTNQALLKQAAQAQQHQSNSKSHHTHDVGAGKKAAQSKASTTMVRQAQNFKTGAIGRPSGKNAEHGERGTASIQKTSRQLSGKTAGKQQAKKNSGQQLATTKPILVDQSTPLIQQSCDVIISTEDGNVSDIEMVEERQSISVNQKSALAVFSQPLESSISLRQNFSVGKDDNELLSKSSLNATTMPRLLKAPAVAKQVKVQLGFEHHSDEGSNSNRNDSQKLGHSNVHSFSAKSQQQERKSQKDQMRIEDGTAAECSPKILMTSPASPISSSFNRANREIPLEERVPNGTTNKITTQISEMSIKQKCRSKILNQTVDEKPHNVRSNQGYKIQAIPTLNLNSFKTRPAAPVTSRNLSNAASLVKKQPARNPNFQPTAKRQQKQEKQTGQSGPLQQSQANQRQDVVQQERANKHKQEQQSKPGKGTASSFSVDARVVRRDLGSAMRINELQRGEHLKASHANISIDLTQNEIDSKQRRSNPQYKTESLERILGSQAEPYFRQLERTMQMGPVNVSQSQNRSQRQASLSQSSRMSGKTGKELQISLTMPGIAEIGSANRRPLRAHNTLVLEPALSTTNSDKKSSFELSKIKATPQIVKPMILQSDSHLGVSSTSMGIGLRPNNLNRDRFVAHRRIDLMCDETADSASVGGTKHGGSLSTSMLKDSTVSRHGNRKKSDSVSSSATTPLTGKQNLQQVQISKPLSSTGRKINPNLGVTRNSKSSFGGTGTNSRLVQSSKQSIAKDWVMCLPNEPPQVIESQRDGGANVQVSVPSAMSGAGGDERTPVCKVTKENPQQHQSRQKKRDEASGNSRPQGKSLLHPSAQKKQLSQRATLVSSKESVEGAGHHHQLSLTKGINVGKRALRSTANHRIQKQSATASITSAVQQVTEMVAAFSPMPLLNKEQPPSQQMTAKPIRMKSPKVASNQIIPERSSNFAVQKQQSEVVPSLHPLASSKHQLGSQRSTSSLKLLTQQQQVQSTKSKKHQKSGSGSAQEKQSMASQQHLQHHFSQSDLVLQQSVISRQTALKSHQSLATPNKALTGSHPSIRIQHQNTGSFNQSNLEVMLPKQERGTDKTTRSSLIQQQQKVQQPMSPEEHNLLFETCDDEAAAAQYYDRLTSLFQETRQKLKEFNEDFNRRNLDRDKKLNYPAYSSVISTEKHERSSAKARESLILGDKQQSASSVASQKRERLKLSQQSSSLIYNQRKSNHKGNGGSDSLQKSANKRDKDPLKMSIYSPPNEGRRSIILSDEKKKGTSSKVKRSSNKDSTGENKKEAKARSKNGYRGVIVTDFDVEAQDNYFQTNNESIDFMVNTRSKKAADPIKSRVSPRAATITTNAKQHQSRNKALNQDIGLNGNNSDPRRKEKRGNNPLTASAAPARKRNSNNNVVEYEQLHTEVIQSRDSSNFQPPLPTNATIYINNVMSSTSALRTNTETQLTSGARRPQQPGQQLMAMPAEMYRTQSQVMYPTMNQLFGPPAAPHQNHHQYLNPMIHQQHHHQHQDPTGGQQQQIVFVPVPMHVQTTPSSTGVGAAGGHQPQQMITAVNSAPQFLTMPQATSLSYQFPQTLSGPLFHHAPTTTHHQHHSPMGPQGATFYGFPQPHHHHHQQHQFVQHDYMQTGEPTSSQQKRGVESGKQTGKTSNKEYHHHHHQKKPKSNGGKTKTNTPKLQL